MPPLALGMPLGEWGPQRVPWKAEPITLHLHNLMVPNHSRPFLRLPNSTTGECQRRMRNCHLPADNKNIRVGEKLKWIHAVILVGYTSFFFIKTVQFNCLCIVDDVSNVFPDLCTDFTFISTLFNPRFLTKMAWSMLLTSTLLLTHLQMMVDFYILHTLS